MFALLSDWRDVEERGKRISRTPRGPRMRTLAPCAMRAGAMLDGLDEIGRAVVAQDGVITVVALRHQRLTAGILASSPKPLRKYQQRGRWQRLPPTVPMLRICGLVASSAALTEPG